MKLQILCGQIASGKSTFAELAAKYGVICVNDDAIVNMIHANNYTLYDEKLKVLYKSVENHVISTALSMGKSILVDRGLNVSIQGRKRWIALANSFDVPCEAIVLEDCGPETHAKRRYESDSRGHSLEYWERVAKVHYSVYSEPTKDEGIEEIIHLKFSEIKDYFNMP